MILLEYDATHTFQQVVHVPWSYPGNLCQSIVTEGLSQTIYKQVVTLGLVRLGCSTTGYSCSTVTGLDQTLKAYFKKKVTV